MGKGRHHSTIMERELKRVDLVSRGLSDEEPEEKEGGDVEVEGDGDGFGKDSEGGDEFDEQAYIE